MYGLPADTDLSFFHGAVLSQLCVGENEVILHFGDQLSLMIASAIEVKRGSKADELDDSRAQARSLLDLLGATVSAASVRSPGTTELAWSDGSVLRVRDSWTDYESYTITHDGDMIVV